MGVGVGHHRLSRHREENRRLTAPEHQPTQSQNTVMSIVMSRRERRCCAQAALLAAVMASAVSSALPAQVPTPGAVDLSVFVGAELPSGKLAQRANASFALGGNIQFNLPIWRISLLANVSYAFASAPTDDLGVRLLHYSAAIEKDFVRTGALNGIGFFANSGIGGFRFDPQTGTATTDLSVHLGLGLEFAAGLLVGVRLEVRDYIILAEPDILNAIIVAVALRIL